MQFPAKAMPFQQIIMHALQSQYDVDVHLLFAPAMAKPLGGGGDIEMLAVHASVRHKACACKMSCTDLHYF